MVHKSAALEAHERRTHTRVAGEPVKACQRAACDSGSAAVGKQLKRSDLVDLALVTADGTLSAEANSERSIA